MLDMYLWFEEPTGGAKEIKGEAQDKDIRDKESGAQPIKIANFKLDIENQTTIGSGSGGASSGKCKLNPFSISKNTDSCSPDFFTACATGGHFGRATILLRKDNKPYIRFTFAMCFVTKVSWGGGEGDEAPKDDIEFAYGALKIMYYPQSKTGETINKPKISVWNQVNNSATESVTQH